MKRKFYNRTINEIVIYVVLVILVIIFIAPFYLVFVNAFKTPLEISKNFLSLPSKFTFDNFKISLEKMDFFNSLFNSLFITISSVIALTIFPAMLAWQLVRNKGIESKIIFGLLVTAMLIPFQSVMLPLVKITDILNMNTIWKLWFVYLGFGAPLATFLFHGFFKSIPTEIEQAAQIDGCNPLQTFFYVILPILKPIIITIAVLNVMWIWNDYLLPKLVLENGETLPIAIQGFASGTYGKEYHLLLSSVFVLIIPAIAFYIYSQKHIIEGITQGSIK